MAVAVHVDIEPGAPLRGNVALRHIDEPVVLAPRVLGERVLGRPQPARDWGQASCARGD